MHAHIYVRALCLECVRSTVYMCAYTHTTRAHMCVCVRVMCVVCTPVMCTPSVLGSRALYKEFHGSPYPSPVVCALSPSTSTNTHMHACVSELKVARG
jgi:hypothetical protein